MAELPSIEELYPHAVRVKHKGDNWGVALRVVKWLEAHKVMNNTDFFLDARYSDEHIAIRFKKKKAARLLKENRKEARSS